MGFSLDEGIAAPGEEIPIFYGERNVFWVRITCPGSPGHGSRFLENTAAEKVNCVAFLFELSNEGFALGRFQSPLPAKKKGRDAKACLLRK